jgi:hypothetical protein
LQSKDPALLNVEHLLGDKYANPLCRHLSTLVGAHPTIEFDEFGTVVHVLASGEFRLALPTALNESTPHNLVTELSFPPSYPLYVFAETLHT